jgi:hypothetical protein
MKHLVQGSKPECLVNELLVQFSYHKQDLIKYLNRDEKAQLSTLLRAMDVVFDECRKLKKG